MNIYSAIPSFYPAVIGALYVAPLVHSRDIVRTKVVKKPIYLFTVKALAYYFIPINICKSNRQSCFLHSSKTYAVTRHRSFCLVEQSIIFGMLFKMLFGWYKNTKTRHRHRYRQILCIYRRHYHQPQFQTARR